MDKPEAEVTVKFRSPSFKYKGQKYISAEVEKKANAGDEDAIAIIANLVKMKSGVVAVVEGEEETTIEKPKNRKKKGGKSNE